MDNKEFKPYVPANKVVPELTVTSIISGLILAIVFGAANAYLGLRVGMTISASIPAAVISMGIFRVLLKRKSILESNIVQTIASAGESIAAGVIFTVPAMFLWAREGILEAPSMVQISLISIFGGVLGVLFMVPLRNALIVKEHGILPYPEGTACADVLLVGEGNDSGAKPVFVGMGVSALIKFLVDGFKVIASGITIPIKSFKTEISTQVYPALIGVGYICGPKICSCVLAGGVIAWLVMIPAIVLFGQNTVLFPSTISIGELYQTGGASAIWSNYIRYIGAGAVAASGITSLIKSLPLIITTFIDALKGLRSKEGVEAIRTNKNIGTKVIGIIVIAIIILMWLLPTIPTGLLGTILVVVFGFFFATVSSRMVGLVGSSNNPASGMTIATLLIVTSILKFTSGSGASGIQSAITIASITCIITCIAGDTSQDLKTGFILGSTPKKQQIGEIIGVVTSSLAIGGILLLLDKAWGFGSAVISAPQASLMKLIVEGVMNGNLPWSLVFIGVFIAISFELLGISSLPVSIGLFLPIELSVTMMIGGIVRVIANRIKEKKEGENAKDSDSDAGVLFCSGMIAGEGLIGILLAVFAVLNIDKAIDFSEVFNTGWIGALITIVVVSLLILRCSNADKKRNNDESKSN